MAVRVQSTPFKLITDSISDRWITDLYELRKLETFIDDETFLNALEKTKEWNKSRMAKYIKEKLDISVNPGSLFDVQVKRIHEYKTPIAQCNAHNISVQRNKGW